jgi:hypothetical protein
MKKSAVLLVVLLVLSAVAYPALAFQADTLTITLDRQGNADVMFTYHLSWVEYFAVFLRIADPGTEIKKALEDNLHKTVIIESAGTDSTRLTVEGYATVKGSGGSATMSTPGLSFEAAQKILESYWFAPLISPDFSPTLTTVRFPDGYEATFPNAITIPPITHSYSP